MSQFICSRCGTGTKKTCSACTSIAARAKAAPFPKELPLFDPEPVPSIRQGAHASTAALTRGFVRRLPLIAIKVFLLVPFIVVGLALIVPALQTVRGVGSREISRWNLKNLLLACHSYHDVHNHLPTPKMIGVKEGNPVDLDLSWRVALLPHLDANDMFLAFDQTVRWDHPRNAQFWDLRPNELACPYHEPEGPSQTTRFQYFTGPRSLFPDNAPVNLREIKDGTTTTLLMAESLSGVTWTQPVDMTVPFGHPLPVPNGGFLAGMADGTVRAIARDQVSDTLLRQLIHPADDKPGLDWNK